MGHILDLLEPHSIRNGLLRFGGRPDCHFNKGDHNICSRIEQFPVGMSYGCEVAE